jgi:hypothetical protein
LLLIALCLVHAWGGEAWTRGKAPIETRWAGEVSPQNAVTEYPRPLLARSTWTNLNGLWDYAITARTVTAVPPSWSGRILVPFCIESSLSGVMQALKPEQKLWYHRTIDIPAAWTGQQIMLHCDAIDWESEVYLDGKLVDRHRGGYDRFSINLTRQVQPGATHHLVVAVSDPTDSSWNLRGKQTLHPGGASYTACSGIWQTVWLEPVPLAAVEALRIVGDHTGALSVTIDGRTPPDPTPVTLRVLDGGTEVAKADGVLGAELVGGVKENLTWYKATRTWVTTTLNLTIPAVKAWSPDSPALYDLVIELKDKNGSVIDRVTSHVGMRTVATATDAQGIMRFHLNGKPLMLPGALDQGFWPDGIYTAPTDAALKYDIEAAKELGLVAIRKHLKIEPERYYYWADRLGLLVLQDLPSGGEGDPFTDEPLDHEAVAVCEMEKRRLIQQRWNHPSIIAWIMFNEGWGQYDTLRHAAWAKQLDPSRLIDEASGFPRHGGGDLHDVHGGNPPKEQRRIGIDSETLGVGLKVSGHMWPGKPWGTGSFDPATGGMKEGWEPTEMDDAAKRWYTRLCADFYRGMWAAKDDTGTSGDFKVQLYDVETEVNGMLTYDRAVWKVDPAVVKRACSGVVMAADTRDIVPCSLTRQVAWRFTTSKPSDAWTTPAFDAASWSEGLNGFGTPAGKGRVGSEWKTQDIWLRHEFSLTTVPKHLILRLLHDEDVEVYLNGVLAFRASGFVARHVDGDIEGPALAALKPGRNVIAVHCHQTVGDQHIDVGLLEVIDAAK